MRGNLSLNSKGLRDKTFKSLKHPPIFKSFTNKGPNVNLPKPLRNLTRYYSNLNFNSGKELIQKPWLKKYQLTLIIGSKSK